MNIEKYNLNIVIDDHEQLNFRHFDNISIWEEITIFVKELININFELLCNSINIYFNNLDNIENLTENYQIENFMKQFYLQNINKNKKISLHDTLSILFEKINKRKTKEYLIIISNRINSKNIDKLLEYRNYIVNLKYIRLFLFSTTKIKLKKEKQLSIFNKSYIIPNKNQIIFILTS